MRKRIEPPDWFRWLIVAGWLGVGLAAAALAGLS